MSIKDTINNIMRVTGYQFSKAQSLEIDIRNGKYLWLQQMGVNTVLDIGANEGQFAAFISVILPDAVIHSFEPVSEPFKLLEKRFENNNNVKCYNFALGSTEGTSVIKKNEYTPSSSILEMAEEHKTAFPHTINSSEEVIKIKTLDSIYNSLLPKNKVLMKIDVQGFEKFVLEGALTTLPSVDIIICETSFTTLYKDQPLFHDVYTFLYNYGFKFHGTWEDVVNPLNGKILQTDSVFIKESY